MSDTMSDECDFSSSAETLQRVPLLDSSANYATWSTLILSYLELHDLDVYLDQDPTQSVTTEELRLNKHCAAALLLSVSDKVLGDIPTSALARKPSRPDLIWSHLNSTYSVPTRAREWELCGLLWRSSIPEYEDPLPHMAKMRSAVIELKNTKIVPTEELEVFWLTVALPASFEQQKKLLLEMDKRTLTRAKVVDLVKMEWDSRIRNGTAYSHGAQVKAT